MTVAAVNLSSFAPGERVLRWRVKPLVFVVSLLPLAWLVWGLFNDALGANPIETLIRSTGEWTLNFLWITLAITPLRGWTGWSWLLRLRRMLGLFAFFYGVLHFMTYVGVDQFFDWGAILKDLTKRPYATIGFVGLLLMTPLAITSTRGMMRRLGGRWQRLHRLVYLVALAAMLHYFWQVKADFSEPLLYLAILLLLFGYRFARLLSRPASA